MHIKFQKLNDLDYAGQPVYNDHKITIDDYEFWFRLFTTDEAGTDWVLVSPADDWIKLNASDVASAHEQAIEAIKIWE
jgi:hypothetical protein